MKEFWHQNHNEGLVALISDRKPILFKDFFKQVLAWKKRETTLSTYRNYCAIYNRFIPILGDYPIDKISGKELDNILDTMDLKTSSRKTYQRILSTLFNDAVRQELLEKNPCYHMRKTRGINLKINHRLPTKEEINSYIKTAKDSNNIFMYKLLILAVSTGMRLGEILNLTRKDIDLDKNIIMVKGQLTNVGPNMPLKTNASYRNIHVSGEVLRNILSNTSGFYVFTPQIITTRQVSRRTADKYIRKFFASIKTPPGFTFHSLRHYHATELLCRGISLKEVSKRLGHASINITADIYTHWLEEMDRSAAEVLGKEFLV